MKHRLAEKLIFSKWREALGGNIKIIVSGGASLQARLSRVFWAAGIEVMEGYGLTETSPVIAVSNFEIYGVKIGTVGPVLPGVTLKFTEDGEICCKGPNVMMGYYKQPEATREVIDAEGWFHTGDIGILVDNMYVKITDRKKEIFKTSGGKYVAPQPIEQRMKESPFIEHIMVVGENRNYAAALIIPNFEHLKSWCEVKHIEFESRQKVVRNPKIIRRIRQEIERFNLDLGQTDKIKKFRLLDAEWTTDSGEISPTLKYRRKFITEKYSQIIEETYRSSEFNYRAE
jgi:long-chain acyl-CoA synthetase